MSETLLISAGLREGNREIFDYVFHQYYSSLVLFSQKYTKSRSEAEDVVQHLFFRLWRDRAELQIHSSIKSFLFTSVRNASIDAIRRERSNNISIDQNFSNEFEIIEEEEEFIVESELKEIIEKALDTLPPKRREIFIQNRFNGLTAKEIAEIESLSVRTVEHHIAKAIKGLREALKDQKELFIILISILS